MTIVYKDQTNGQPDEAALSACLLSPATQGAVNRRAGDMHLAWPSLLPAIVAFHLAEVHCFAEQNATILATCGIQC
ncbi:MAG TPA: hypothetical protein EYP14_16640 [Planctomycetaceae bacterium]|nr:hypothetical protein [Planctomycetaceae bacterium]